MGNVEERILGERGGNGRKWGLFVVGLKPERREVGIEERGEGDICNFGIKFFPFFYFFFFLFKSYLVWLLCVSISR